MRNIFAPWRKVRCLASSPACLLGALGLSSALLGVQQGHAQSQSSTVVACNISGYSLSKDRAGAPVRAAPSATAKVVGRLAPPQKATAADKEDVPPADEVWRTEFKIIGYSDGWFQIRDALHPYDDPNRRGVLGKRSTGGVKTYSGDGWLNLSMVGGKYTFFHRSISNGALFKDPDTAAERLPAKNAMGYAIQGGNVPKKILGCTGEWVKVESHDDVVGWWKGLCGQPIGDCDQE